MSVSPSGLEVVFGLARSLTLDASHLVRKDLQNLNLSLKALARSLTLDASHLVRKN